MWNLLAVVAGVGAFVIVEDIMTFITALLYDMPIISSILSFPTSPVLYLYSIKLIVPAFSAMAITDAICNKSAKFHFGVLVMAFLIFLYCINAIINSIMAYGFVFDFFMPPVFCIGVTCMLAYSALKE